MMCYRSLLFLIRLRNSRLTQDIQSHEVSWNGWKIQLFPPERNAKCTLVMIPGLHPRGIFDTRFQRFARACASAGFYVVALDIVEFRRFEIPEKLPDQIESLLLHLPAMVPEGALQNLGMLGISHGTGPMFAAAVNAKTRVQFLVSIGGYSNLQQSIRFALTGSRKGEQPKNLPQPWGRLIFAYLHAEELAGSYAGRIRECIELRLNLQNPEAERAERALPPDAIAVMSEILGGFSERWKNVNDELIARFDSLSGILSPEKLVSKLPRSTRFYLLHGRDDDLVPAEETLDLERKLQELKYPHCHTLVTGYLTHVDTIASWNRLHDAVTTMMWLRHVLRESL